MSTVAEQLRQAREAQNLTIQQVAEITKNRTDHVRAIEEGDYDVFAAPVYVRGFARTYAALLGLDSKQIIQQINEELAKSEKHNQPPHLSPRPQTILDIIMYQLSKLRWRILLPTLVIVALAVAAWFYYKANWGSSGVSAPVDSSADLYYKPDAKDHGQTLPLPGQGRK